MLIPYLMNTALTNTVLVSAFLLGTNLLGAGNSLAASRPVVVSSPAEEYFTDITLVTHNGNSQRFYKDLLKDKVVIIHSFFSSCKSSCPVSMRLMGGIQERFSDKMGKELHILSFSLDPETDTPLKLKSYAKELNVGPGWNLISGNKHNINAALKKIGHYVENIDAHKNTIIIGNEATGLWKKVFLLAGRDSVDNVIRSVLEDEIPDTDSAD